MNKPTPKLPSDQHKQKTQSPTIKHTPQSDSNNLAIKAAFTPFAMAAGMAPGTYLVSRMRAGTAIKTGTPAVSFSAAALTMFRALPLGTGKQVGKSFSLIPATAKKDDPAIIPSAIAAVTFETSLSGLSGLISVVNTGKVTPPCSNKIWFYAASAAALTPHCASWTAASSACTIFSLAGIKPAIKLWAYECTPNKTAANVISSFTAGLFTSLATCPINTIGFRYLNSMTFQTTASSKPEITVTKSMAQVTKDIFRNGYKNGIFQLYKAAPVMAGLSGLAFLIIDAVDVGVDALINNKI